MSVKVCPLGPQDVPEEIIGWTVFELQATVFGLRLSLFTFKMQSPVLPEYFEIEGTIQALPHWEEKFSVGDPILEQRVKLTWLGLKLPRDKKSLSFAFENTVESFNVLNRLVLENDLDTYSEVVGIDPLGLRALIEKRNRARLAVSEGRDSKFLLN